MEWSGLNFSRKGNERFRPGPSGTAGSYNGHLGESAPFDMPWTL